MDQTDADSNMDPVLVEGHMSFTLVTLCQAVGAAPQQVHALVDEGLLRPTGQGPADWGFSGDALQRTRVALRLSRDFELGAPGVVLVMDLLAQIETLRTRLRCG
jgi:chaperone modulatory protein CbpM